MPTPAATSGAILAVVWRYLTASMRDRPRRGSDSAQCRSLAARFGQAWESPPGPVTQIRPTPVPVPCCCFEGQSPAKRRKSPLRSHKTILVGCRTVPSRRSCASIRCAPGQTILLACEKRTSAIHAWEDVEASVLTATQNVLEKTWKTRGYPPFHSNAR